MSTDKPLSKEALEADIVRVVNANPYKQEAEEARLQLLHDANTPNGLGILQQTSPNSIINDLSQQGISVDIIKNPDNTIRELEFNRQDSSYGGHHVDVLTEEQNQAVLSIVDHIKHHDQDQDCKALQADLKRLTESGKQNESLSFFSTVQDIVNDELKKQGSDYRLSSSPTSDTGVTISQNDKDIAIVDNNRVSSPDVVYAVRDINQMGDKNYTDFLQKHLIPLINTYKNPPHNLPELVNLLQDQTKYEQDTHYYPDRPDISLSQDGRICIGQPTYTDDSGVLHYKDNLFYIIDTDGTIKTLSR